MKAKFLVFDIYVETIIYLLLNNFHDCNFKYVCVCVCVCVREKKINSFDITAIIFKAYKKCKSPIQTGF